MLTPMTPDQRRHLDEVDAIWPRYAALAGSREDHAGGMQWKSVNGAEYLTRYRPDPRTGKKVAKSLGRRSPETERLFREFSVRRDAAKAELAELAPRIEMAGRIGKAVRLARLPSAHADGHWRLWEAGLLAGDVATMVGGGAALTAYETRARVLAPGPAIRDDDGLSFFVLGDAGLAWRFAMEFGSLFGGRDAHLETRESGPGRIRVSVDGVALTLFGGDALERGLRDSRASPDIEECVMKATRMPPICGYAVSRDARIAPMVVPDPRAYCLLAPLLACEDGERREQAWSRAAAVEEIVRDHWPRTFSADEEEALAGLREMADHEGGRLDMSP